MKTLQNKIILLTVIILALMAGLWLFLNYQNQQTIEKYNAILQRYLMMNELTALSADGVNKLSRYTSNPNSQTEFEFKQSISRFDSDLAMLPNLLNSGNRTTLINFTNMISSLMESMKLSSKATELQQNETALSRLEEAAQINTLIHEEMLTLFNQELNTYNNFYITMIKQSADLRKLGFWSLGLASSLLFVFSYRFIGRITQPIRTLVATARVISTGNFDNPIETKGKDELSLLSVTMNRMRLNIKNLIEEMKEKAQMGKDLQEHKLLLKESELRSLQNQINPHFLFNTLNTLSKKAYLEGAEETSELITSVSDLLRYNLSSLKGVVTLREEMHIIQEYLYIQKARFGSRVRYEVLLDDSCLGFFIPCLTLQPFIENAFIHAIEPMEEGGTIRIAMTRQGEHAFVTITDDGGGMQDEQIQAIMNNAEEVVPRGHSTGIGIHNVIRRLQLYYGTDDVVTIVSKAGVGTEVRLTLPKQGGLME